MIKTCSIKRCKSPGFCKTYCTKHYQRFHAHGSPMAIKIRETGQGTIHRGYKWITVNKKQVLEHRHFMEVHLGRKLESNKHVHHINGKKLDNRLKNLKVMTPGQHTIAHATFRNKTHKQCTQCKEIKPRSEFNRDNGPKTDAHYSWCKNCKHLRYEERKDERRPNTKCTRCSRPTFKYPSEFTRSKLGNLFCSTKCANIHNFGSSN